MGLFLTPVLDKGRPLWYNGTMETYTAKVSPEMLGWTASLIDTKGYLHISSMDDRFAAHLRIPVHIRRKRVVERVVDLWANPETGKPAWRQEGQRAIWEISGRILLHILKCTQPLMCEKHEVALEVLNFQRRIYEMKTSTPGVPLSAEEIEIRRGFYERVEALNRPGGLWDDFVEKEACLS